MKVKTRRALSAGLADCGHPVREGRAVVRRGRRWVCTACSLPGGTTYGPARCPACGLPMGGGSRIALRRDGRWCHQDCVNATVLALAEVTWTGQG